MKANGSLLALSLFLLWPVQHVQAVEPFPHNGEIYQSFRADLDRDGKTERIDVLAYNVSEDEYWGQILVRDAIGKTLWQGPRSQNIGDLQTKPVVGGFNAGVCDVQMVGDMDGDGKIELVSSQLQSDLRPTTFRVFRWNGSAFALARQGTLVETVPNTGVFTWSGKVSASQTAWISKIEYHDQILTGEIYLQDLHKGLMLGKARLGLTSNGYKILSWTVNPT